MKVFVIGSDGFIGSHVAAALIHGGHEVQRGRWDNADDGSHHIDLSDTQSIQTALKATQPDAVLNCAGIVANNEKARLNITMTSNLLNAITELGLDLKRIIITGSSAEYGLLDPKNIPVKETAPLRPNNLYGESKRDEVAAAQELAKQHSLPLVVARLFNPIGPGMAPRMLVPALLRQIAEIKAGERHAIEISRLDSQRDYIHVKDVARAYQALVEGDLQHDIYNVGSGTATSNAELVDLIIKASGLENYPKITETAPEPEPLVAIAADTTRLRELGWKPALSLSDTVQEIVTSARAA